MPSMTPTTPRRAVMWQIPPEIEAWRKRTGADRHDEVWGGVIHMAPWPTNRHQGLGLEMAAWAIRYWQHPARGKVLAECTVARPGMTDWREDYRVPDLVLLRPEHYARDADSHFDGGPSVVVEIDSLMAGSCASRALTSVDLPAPDGAATMNRLPEKCWLICNSRKLGCRPKKYFTKEQAELKPGVQAVLDTGPTGL